MEVETIVLGKGMIPFKHALLTRVLLTNGKITEMITVFNATELSFEEINTGVKRGLESTHVAQEMQSTFYGMFNNKLEPVAIFENEKIR